MLLIQLNRLTLNSLLLLQLVAVWAACDASAISIALQEDRLVMRVAHLIEMRLAASSSIDHHGHGRNSLLGVHFKLSAHHRLLIAKVLPVLEHLHVRVIAF